MPKGSLELTNARKEEIIEACKLNECMIMKEPMVREALSIGSF